VGGWYQGGQGQIMLITKNGKPIMQGEKVNNHLYKMKMKMRNPLINNVEPIAFVRNTNAPNVPSALSWETWHQCFSHIRYSRLQRLLDGKMVEGFNVDVNTPKPDCEACITAKQHTQPYPKSLTWKTMAGDLTHIDLWGKYAIKLINGNQYYLLFVDNTTRYISIQFLKEKSDVVQKVTNYLAYMDSQEKKPKAIQKDCSTELVNETLNSYCTTRSIDIRLTTPYSPSQNRIVGE
jgi:hypothetical protein